MKIIIFLLVLSSIYSCGSQLTLREIRNAESIIIYDTSEDYVHNNPMKINAKAVINKGSKQYISFKKIFNSDTGKVIKKWDWFWAINYEGDNYFNLLYSKDLKRARTFVKFNIEGEICAIIIDKNSSDVLKNITNQNIAFTNNPKAGIGVSFNIFDKTNKNQANKKVIFIIETNVLAPKFGARKAGSFAYYLGYSRLKDLIKDNNIKIDYDKISDIPFKKVIKIIESLNKKNK